MTLRELYNAIDGDYDQALKVLRIDKLIDKHIRKLPDNKIFSDLFEAGKTLDSTGMFESAHAIKGVCANMGLVKLASLSETVCNEFRPGNERKLTDDQVKGLLDDINVLYKKTEDGIRKYEQSAQ